MLCRIPDVAQQMKDLEAAGLITGLTQWGQILQQCHTPWQKSQMLFGSGVAVAYASAAAPVRPLAQALPDATRVVM